MRPPCAGAAESSPRLPRWARLAWSRDLPERRDGFVCAARLVSAGLSTTRAVSRSVVSQPVPTRVLPRRGSIRVVTIFAMAASFLAVIVTAGAWFYLSGDHATDRRARFSGAISPAPVDTIGFQGRGDPIGAKGSGGSGTPLPEWAQMDPSPHGAEQQGTAIGTSPAPSPPAPSPPAQSPPAPSPPAPSPPAPPPASPQPAAVDEEAEQRIWISRQLLALEAIRAECVAVHEGLVAICAQPAMGAWQDVTAAISPLLARLSRIEQQILELQLSTHRDGPRLAGSKPHRFVASVWPTCRAKDCRLNEEFVDVWLTVLRVLTDSREQIDSSWRKQLEYARALAMLPPFVFGRDEALRSIDKAYGAMLKNGPRRILDTQTLSREVEELYMRSGGGRK